MEHILDRKVAPVSKAIEYLEQDYPSEITFNNGVKLYNIVAGDQELIKIDLIFDAGTWRARRPLLAGLTAAMMKEGTESYNQFEIAEKIDFYGAYINVSPGYDTTMVSALTLKRHLNQILPMLSEIVINPTFPEDKLEIIKEKRKQQFIQESEKVSKLSQREFWRTMFGADHPYSPHNSVELYDGVKSDDLRQFHKEAFGSDGLEIVVCGQADSDSIKLIESFFGDREWGGKVSNSSDDNISFKAEAGYTHVEKDEAVQNSISMGLVVPGRDHKDHHGIALLNTVLGGYFGSRLNMNLREEKGYTYGIYSGYVNFLNGSSLIISSEVGSDVCQESIDEIIKEMSILRETLMSEEELLTVKNYMLGKILNGFDGPFNKASSFHVILESDLSYSYYTDKVNLINSITAEQVRELACRYLIEDKLIVVTAGVL